MKNVDRNDIEYAWRMIAGMQSILWNCSQKWFRNYSTWKSQSMKVEEN